ncbi:MAG: diaminopimelate epimerase, partial [Prevotella sp.]|nr:diaminopimelate epimerase [Prevotella sp.]
VNTMLYDIPNPNEVAKAWSAYHIGIGSDGLVLIGKARQKDADFSMRIFNADGSEAMMCGNASRCIGKYLYEHKLTNKTSIRLETLSGIKTLELNVKDDKVLLVKVDMNSPKFEEPLQFNPKYANKPLMALDKEFLGTFVSMGNPHYVIFMDDVEKFPVSKYGSLLENHEAFPQRCNIEFAQITPEGIRLRVWERGSGITMACGTGACATAVAATKTLGAQRSNHIIMDGGDLDITWDATSSNVYMTGGATEVFEGEICL